MVGMGEEAIVQKHFTSTEWRMMYFSVIGLRDFLSVYHSDVRAFTFICERTLRFRKFVESVPLRHFQIGVLGMAPPIYGYPFWGNGSLRRTLKRLEDRNVIQSIVPGSGKTNQYILNAPDLMSLAYLVSQKEALALLARKVELLYAQMGWGFPGELVYREDLIMKLEDKINQAFSESAAAMEKRAEKRAKKNNPLWIYDFIKDHCQVEDIRWSEQPFSKKTRGQAKWWMSKCYIEGIDPRVRLREVCDRWKEISKFLADQRIKVKNTVSFAEYVTWWHKINDFLDGAYEAPKIDRWWEEPEDDQKPTGPRYDTEVI